MITSRCKRQEEWRILRHKRSIGEYLAFLAIKYEVDPEKFFYAFTLSRRTQKSKCDNLSIECRSKIKNKFVFLIMRDTEVIAQFPILEEFLLNRGNQLGNFMKTEMIRRHLLKKSRTSTARSIKDLRTGMRHVNLKAKILEVTEPTHVVTRYGNNASVAKALIADETGTIKLCLWNDQIGSVSVGDTIQIENARASIFRGERQLSIGKKGTLNNVESPRSQLTSMDLPTAKT
jgi:replication factor A1